MLQFNVWKEGKIVSNLDMRLELKKPKKLLYFPESRSVPKSQIL